MDLEQVVAELEKDIIKTAKKWDRAKIIYDWVRQNIEYDYVRRDNLAQGMNLDPQTPDETLLRRKGVCSDQAILYTTLGRIFRLNVDYASVKLKGDSHAINIARTEKGTIQIDTTNGIFGADYQNYKIRDIHDIQRRQHAIPAQIYNQRCSWLKSALIAAGIGSVVALGVYLIPPLLKGNNVKYLETNDSVRFITKNGDLRFTLDEDAKKLVKEAFFYTEAIEGDAKDKDLLAPYVTADVNGDNHFTKEEAKDARDRARADYLRSLR